MVLDRISELIKGASPASSPSTSISYKSLHTQPQSQTTTQAQSPKQEDPIAPQPSSLSVPKTPKEKDAFLLEGARICTAFAQATAVVEQCQDAEAEARDNRKGSFHLILHSRILVFLGSVVLINS